MSNTRTKSFDLPTSSPNLVIEVEVRYTTPNAGNDYRQGYWVHMAPVRLEKHFRATNASCIVKRFVLAANRFTQKQLDAIYDDVHQNILNGNPQDAWVKEVRKIAEDKCVCIAQ